MGVVHGLESNAGIIAVKIAVLYKVFDGIDYLEETLSIGFAKE